MEITVTIILNNPPYKMIYPIAFHMKTTADKINANTDQTKAKNREKPSPTLRQNERLGR